MTTISRREFARISAYGAAGLWMAGCTDPTGLQGTPGELPGSRPSKRVAVVGAGVSGLVAAYELGRAGHDVMTFEARDRVGGRVLTLRDPFAPGQLAEAGAARIRPEHDVTLGYLRHFAIDTDPFYPTAGAFVELAGGQRIERDGISFRAQRPEYVKVRAGTDALPAAFASELTGALELGTAVSGITRVAAGARLTLDDGSSIDVDRVLLTAPLTVYDRIAFDPPLSAAKATAASGGFDYQDATRVYVRMRSRFWEMDGLNGWGVTDWPEEIWQPTWDAVGPEGVLLTYVRGDRARDLDARTPDDRLATLLAHWEEVFPGVSAEAISATTHSWQNEEWTRAAWAAPTSTQDSQLSAEIARPEGPIHFAGEHASDDRGWMQGALASGIRAAREIHDA